jgi:hypothetical protein
VKSRQVDPRLRHQRDESRNEVHRDGTDSEVSFTGYKIYSKK